MTNCLHRLTSVSPLSSVFLTKCLISISDALKIIDDGVREYSQKLRDHEKFDLPQVQYVSQKNTSRPSRCSGCLQPTKIMPGGLHFYAEGLLDLEKDDKDVETKLRFCLATSCTTKPVL